MKDLCYRNKDQHSRGHSFTDSPSCGSIVAVVGKEVIVQFPKDMQCGPAVWGQHIVVGLSQLSIKVIQHQQLRQQLMGQLGHLN